jgi:hypothetical protein
MTIQVLDTVVLVKDIPSHGLRTGDLGAVVDTYEPDGIEVEFVAGSGRTRALITLKVNDVRSVSDTDIPAVRSMVAA